jgi:hypothetical protein
VIAFGVGCESRTQARRDGSLWKWLAVRDGKLSTGVHLTRNVLRGALRALSAKFDNGYTVLIVRVDVSRKGE